MLRLQSLAEMGAAFAVLFDGRCALPVRYRIRGTAVECQVPTWCDMADGLKDGGEVILVAVTPAGPDLRWFFIRGQAEMVANPDWQGFEPPGCGRISPDELYQLLQIRPVRMEYVDERLGWGVRDTVDL